MADAALDDPLTLPPIAHVAYVGDAGWHERVVQSHPVRVDIAIRIEKVWHKDRFPAVLWIGETSLFSHLMAFFGGQSRLFKLFSAWLVATLGISRMH